MTLVFEAHTSPLRSSFLKADALDKEEGLPLSAMLLRLNPSLHQFEITSMVMVKTIC